MRVKVERKVGTKGAGATSGMSQKSPAAPRISRARPVLQCRLLQMDASCCAPAQTP